MREEEGGGTGSLLFCTLLHSIGGIDWEDMANSGNNGLGCKCADVGLLGMVGKKGMLEWGNIPDKVPMNTEKAAFKSNREVYSNVGDRSLKYELQVQLMAENMEGIMHIIAHRMDTSGKKGFRVDRKEVERGEKSCSVREGREMCIVRGERRVVVTEKDR